MTVRVNKSAFNIREKLSELERPIGVKGNELMRAETAQEAGSLLGVGRRNLCVNGNFKIWQRGTSIAGGASGNTSNSYKYVTADHWQTYFYNTYARQDSVLPSGERVYSFRETFYTGRLFFAHIIEDGGRIFNQGDYITISFWAKTSGPSTGVSLGFYWYDGPNWVGGTYTYANIRNNVIIEGSEWKYYTATTQIPANANNRQHLAIEFDNYSPYGPLFGGSWTQLSGTDWWEFANIQIEKGKVATEFEHRSYGEELALCQRYYEKSFPDDVAPARGTSTTSLLNGGQPTSTLDWYATFSAGTLATHHYFRVPKRGTPQMTLFGTSDNKCIFFDFGTKSLIYPGLVIDSPTKIGFRSYNNGSGLTNNSSWGLDVFNWTAEAEL